MDTDIFSYDFKTDDLYSDIKTDISTHFDTPTYPKHNPSNFPKIIKKMY